jgi:hypothetical protein
VRASVHARARAGVHVCVCACQIERIGDALADDCAYAEAFCFRKLAVPVPLVPFSAQTLSHTAHNTRTRPHTRARTSIREGREAEERSLYRRRGGANCQVCERARNASCVTTLCRMQRSRHDPSQKTTAVLSRSEPETEGRGGARSLSCVCGSMPSERRTARIRSDEVKSDRSRAAVQLATAASAASQYSVETAEADAGSAIRSAGPFPWDCAGLRRGKHPVPTPQENALAGRGFELCLRRARGPRVHQRYH